MRGNAQGSGKLFDVAEGNVPRPPLYMSHERPVQIAFERQVFLRPAALRPQRPQVAREYFSCARRCNGAGSGYIHAPDVDFESLLSQPRLRHNCPCRSNGFSKLRDQTVFIIKETVNMQCPACKSDQTQRLEVIYEGGTQDVSATSYTAGAGILGASSAKLGLGGAVTATSGQSQSKLAQRVAPPMKKSLKWPVILAAIGLLLLMSALSSKGTGDTAGAVPVALVFAAPGAFWLYFVINFNIKKWPSLYREWSLNWYCNKCGSVFKPE